MSRTEGVPLLCGLLLCATAGTARADAAIGVVSSTEIRVPGNSGELERFGAGVGASILYLCGCDEFLGGFEGSTTFIIGANGERLYDLGVSVIGSFPLKKDTLAIPFVSFGLDLAAVTIPDPDDPESKARGVSAGVHGNLGLHGYLSKSLYWRGQVGYLGAGVGGVTGQVALGYVFGK